MGGAKGGGARARGPAGGSGKAGRQLQAQRRRQEHRQELLQERRRALRGAPRTVAVLPCCEGVDVQALWGLLQAAAGGGPDAAEAAAAGGGEDERMDVEVGAAGVTVQTWHVPAQKLRVTLLPPPPGRGAGGQVLALLETVRVADVVLMVTRAGHPDLLDQACKDALHALRVQGMPSVLGVVQGLSLGPLAGRAALKKFFVGELKQELGHEPRVLGLDSAEDARQLFRFVKEGKLTAPQWRSQRPYVLAEAAEYEAGPDAGRGTLKLRGYVRGIGLSANQLVHLPGAGDYNIARVGGPADPHRPGRAPADGMDGEGGTLAESDPERRERFVRANTAEEEMEQTWPTAEELAEAERAAAAKRVPKGTSSYQAAWILEEEGGAGYSDEEGGEEEDDDPDAMDLVPVEEADRLEALAAGEDDEEYRDFIPGEEDELKSEGQRKAEAERERRSRKDAEDEELEYPDEVATPFDVPARHRFAKYRGLKSFRTSPWDPKETLPVDYSRIFAFKNPKRAHRAAVRGHAEALGGPAGVAPGMWVCVHVEGVEAGAAAEVGRRVAAGMRGEAAPYALFGLLEHECKMSVLHFAVTKSPLYAEPLPNKQELVFYTGVRTFRARPIFSADEPNADKHKMERFLHPGTQCVASVYAPILYGPLPVVCLGAADGGAAASAAGAGALAVAATGQLRGANPDRIVLKKIILTGYPYRVHKRNAVVKHMFYNHGDIKWFKPLELWTKYGQRGLIRDAVGTHGMMKCVFDGVVQQRDTVCISLYKRVYPKWPAEEGEEEGEAGEGLRFVF